MKRERIQQQLSQTLQGTQFEKLGDRYQGKVRDVYNQGEQLVIVTSDRVSAFDHVLGTVPFKGQILNAIALAAFEGTEHIVPNHVLSAPHANVMVGKRCEAYPIEFIVRAYITGSLWRDYESGSAGAYGLDFPEGLKKDQKLPELIITPTTKAQLGAHDEAISKEEIIKQGLLTEEQFDQAAEVSLELFKLGQKRAADKGLILVDTKYELGEDSSGQLTVIDEIHTPDSSRYWKAESYQELFEAGKKQAMLDKENLRGWLIDTHGFKGQGEPPALSDDIRVTLAERYLELHELMVGKPLEVSEEPPLDSLEKALRNAGLFTES